MTAYRSPAPHESPRTLVVYGQRSFKPLLALVFATPLLIMFSRTTLECSRARDLCTFHTSGLLGGGGSVMLSRVSTMKPDSERGMMRPAFVLRDGARMPLSPQNDSFSIDDKQSFMNAFMRYQSSNEDDFDDGYGPSLGLIVAACAFIAAIAAFIAWGRQRAVIVVDPRTDVTEVTVYPGLGKLPQRTRLAHAGLSVAPHRLALFDSTGISIDLPPGTSRHSIETLRDLLGL